VRIRRLDEQTVVISGLDAFCCELLHQITVSAQSDNAAARARLFSSPTRAREPELESDWRKYVHPELQQIFQSAREIVESDLKDFPVDPAADFHTLPIPVSHLEAWIHSLNQARLALAASFEFREEEMEREIATDGDTRALALFQTHFYGFLMEYFLREVDAAS
jgi:Domain of unknown function (DUF2017)